MATSRAQIQVVRGLVALCGLAAVSPDDVRADLTDEAVWALELWLSPEESARDELRAWCDSMGARLRLLSSSADERLLLRAQVALLRLRAALPAPTSTAPVAAPAPVKEKIKTVKAPSVGANQRKLLAAVEASGPIRAKDLIALLAGQLSDRTVKRSLKDLVTSGLLRRTEGDSGVVYEAAVKEA